MTSPYNKVGKCERGRLLGLGSVPGASDWIMLLPKAVSHGLHHAPGLRGL